MPPRAVLSEAALHYAPGHEVFTATSGKLPALKSLFLTLDYGSFRAFSEARINVAYATGYAEPDVRAEAVAMVRRLALSGDPAADHGRVDTLLPSASPAVRLLVEAALQDAAARAAGASLAERLGGSAGAPSHATNQTLFLGDMGDVLARAHAYVARGYMDLKLRVGAGPPEDDIARLARIREEFGDGITLSADANGAWSRDTFAHLAPALADLGLFYIEQPLGADDEAGLIEAARASPVPLMLDESVPDATAVGRYAASGAPFLFHLKLAKLGGIDRLIEAARVAVSHGAPVMIGQMNEGALATAAALAAAVALRPAHAELYGADGLADDPAGTLTYADGSVTAGHAIGLGVDLTGPTAILATNGAS